MTTERIVIIVLSVVILALLVVIAAMVFAQQKKKKASKHATYVKDGVRYTYRDETHTEEGKVAVTHREGDVVLEKGVTYVATKAGPLLPGKYTILAAQETTKAFNVRLGGLVREYLHDSDIVLAEGEEITPVSHTVILR